MEIMENLMKTVTVFLLSVSLFFGGFCAANSMETEFSRQGIRVSREGREYFFLYFQFAGQGEGGFPDKVEVADNLVKLQYPIGVTATLRADGNRLIYDLEKRGRAESFTQYLFLPKNSVIGGSYCFDGKKLGSLPPLSGPARLLDRRQAKHFTLALPDRNVEISFYDQSGGIFTGATEFHAGWNGNTGPAFQYTFKGFFDRKEVRRIILAIEEEQIGSGKAAVDRFGQPAGMDFPGKIKSEKDLRQDVLADKIYYAGLKPPEFSPFGGMRNGPKFPATGFFRLERTAGRDLLITPTGEPYFHLAVCGVGPCDDFTFVEGRRNLYEWLPPLDGEFATAYLERNPAHFSFYIANVIRKTGKPFDWDEWKGKQVGRLRKWGFNSSGAFAQPSRQMLEQNFPYTTTLPVAELPQLLPLIFDPFEPEIPRKLDDLFKNRLSSRADDPLLVGYFISNEQRYTDICRKLPQFKADKAAKRKLADFLRKRYPDIEEFNRRWKCSLRSFEELAATALPVETEEALADMQEFTAVFLEAYFRLVYKTFRKYDSNHLLLGARFLTAATRELESAVVICGKYTDVFSVNYYSPDIDVNYLERLHKLAGRPLMLSEWSFGSAEQGLSGGCVDVANETERGIAYRNYVEQSAALPYVIGNQWFAYLDQALTGRWFQKYNGENMNIGLLNVADRPFKTFLKAVMATNYRIYDVVMGKVPPYRKALFSKKNAAPKRMLIPRACPGMKIDCQYTGWPERPAMRIGAAELAVGTQKQEFSADFNFCWDDENLYVFAVVREPTPGINPFSGKELWRGDGLEFFFGPKSPEKTGILLFSDRQLIIGATPDTRSHWYNAVRQYPVETCYQRHPDRKGWTLEAAIPWEAIGVRPESGMTFRFDFAVDETDSIKKRLRQFVWSGDDRNSQFRTNWGTAVLVD